MLFSLLTHFLRKTQKAPKGILEKDFISLAEDIINLENGNQVLGWLQQSARILLIHIALLFLPNA